VALAARGEEVRAFGDMHYRLRAGQAAGAGNYIEHLCCARLVPGMALLKLDSFREQWQAQEVRRGDGCFVFRVSAGGNLWQRFLGKSPGLEVGVRLLPPRPETGGLTPVSVTVRPADCRAEQAAELLGEVGPVLLDSVRNYLQAQAMPGQERFPLGRPVRVLPSIQGRPGEAIAALGKDISLGGMGLYLPCRPPSLEVYLELTPAGGGQAVRVRAQVLQSEPCGDGRLEVEVGFLWG
jgi:hypothetical protein